MTVTVGHMLSQRLHVELAGVAMAGLVISGLTGIVMSLNRFGLLGNTAGTPGALPPVVDGGTPAAIGSLAALQDLPLPDLRELSFLYAGDPTDVFTLITSMGQRYVDQASGALLNFTPNGLGCVMPISSSWWAAKANPLGALRRLYRQLALACHKAHVAPMNALASDYPLVKQLLVLTATYGNGNAPASANHFFARLERLKAQAGLQFAVLGFGDRRFAQFCRFAVDIEAALLETGLVPILPFATIDRQSAEGFAQWGQALGQALATAFSRVVGGRYVQDRLRDDAATIRVLVASGAQIMVCGGRQIAEGVRVRLDFCLSSTGESVGTLKAQGRYLEDVY